MTDPSKQPIVHHHVDAGVTARYTTQPEERAKLRMCGMIMAPLYGLGLGVLAGIAASNAHPGITSIGVGVGVGGVSCKVIHALFKRALRQAETSPRTATVAPATPRLH